MKKLKKFNLHQSRFLSADDMVKLNGGEYLHKTCDSNNVGKSCIVTIEGKSYSGTCIFTDLYTSAGSYSTTIKGYFCDPSF